MTKITADQAVRVLKELRVSSTSKPVAEMLCTSCRAVATALQSAVKDGRVTQTFKKGRAFYRFVRLTPTDTRPAAHKES